MASNSGRDDALKSMFVRIGSAVVVLCVSWRRFCTRTFINRIHIRIFETVLDLTRWKLFIRYGYGLCLPSTAAQATCIDHWQRKHFHFFSFAWNNRRGHTVRMKSRHKRCLLFWWVLNANQQRLWYACASLHAIYAHRKNISQKIVDSNFNPISTAGTELLGSAFGISII